MSLPAGSRTGKSMLRKEESASLWTFIKHFPRAVNPEGLLLSSTNASMKTAFMRYLSAQGLVSLLLSRVAIKRMVNLAQTLALWLSRNSSTT